MITKLNNQYMQVS